MAQRARHVVLFLAFLVSALAATRASADGIGVTAQPGYVTSSTRATDETGRTTAVDTSALLQRYRLTLDETLYPTLIFNAGGNLDWTKGWSTTDSLSSRADDRVWNAYARMRWGNPLLGGGLDYDRRWESAESTSAGVTQTALGFTRESYTGALGWHPADLPTLDLRLGRSLTYDSQREVQDVRVDEVQLSSKYDPNKATSARYSLRLSDSDDRIHDFQTTTVENSLAATWTDSFLGNRGTAYVGYNVGTRNTDVSAAPGSTGQIFTAQLPTAGLSKVEVFPETPERVTLAPNTKLIDGLTTATAGVSASAGINIGTSGDVITDRAVRDVGAQFANAVTPVSEIDVWVDQQLPAAIAQGLTWTAYQSDDNVTWTQVARAGPVTFDLFTPRFRIPIVRTSARYLKVSARPLAAAVTSDPRYAEIFVTEVQFFDVSSVAAARGRSFSLGGNLTGSARVALVRSLGLAYDAAVLMTHSNGTGGVTWSFTNGLSAAQRLSRVFNTAQRVERSDSDFGAGHEAVNRWSLSLGVDPLPTLGALVNYSGQISQRLKGTAVSNGVSGTLRADVYEGVAMSANSTASLTRNEQGRLTRSVTEAGSLSLIPNRVVQLTTTVAYNGSMATGGGQPDATTRNGLGEAAISLSPFPALALSGSVLRYFAVERPSTLASFTAGFSPLPGGDVQLRYGYDETLDTSTETRTRNHGPSFRWNIRPAWYLEGGFQFTRTTSPAETVVGRVGNVNLFITMH